MTTNHEDHQPLETPDPTPGRRRRSGVVAIGAALGLTLAGFGVAAAQEQDPSTTTTAPAAEAKEGAEEGDKRVLGRHRAHCHLRHGPKPALSAAATAIGISEAELRTALMGGQSMAQVATSKGVAPQKVVDALVAEAKAKLAANVAAGDITQAQADRRSATLVEHISQLVNREGGLRHRDGPGRHRLRPPADAAEDPAAATSLSL